MRFLSQINYQLVAISELLLLFVPTAGLVVPVLYLNQCWQRMRHCGNRTACICIARGTKIDSYRGAANPKSEHEL
jgi:hypothetical protein